MKVVRFLLVSLLSSVMLVNNVFADNTEQPLKIIPLADDLYHYTSYKHVDGFGLVPSNGLIVVNGNDAFLIDTPWTDQDTAQLLNWITEKKLSLKGSISTHWHADRSGGINYLNQQGIKTYATSQTNQLLKLNAKAMASSTLNAVHNVLFHDKIETYYPGAGHSSDNIVVWLPKHQLLFGGCLIKSLSSKSLGDVGDADINAWPVSVANVQAKYPSVKTVIPGHGKTGDDSLLRHTRALTAKSDKHSH
ncbi:DIM/SIM/IMP family subclass B1 metallo-beta-lactamase [Thalassotalea fusca]